VLLAAAAEEFARHGSRGARVAEIVRRAGVNERMIYHHFGSKDGLYQAVLADQMGGLAEQWLPVIQRATQLDPAAGLRLALRGYFDAFHARPLLAPLVLHEAMTDWTARPPLNVDNLPAGLLELYRRGQRDGLIRADIDIAVIHATAITALVAAPTVRGLAGNPLADPDRAARVGDQIVDLLLDGIIGGRRSSG
jgi:AcrR family transcriptional regulator